MKWDKAVPAVLGDLSDKRIGSIGTVLLHEQLGPSK